MRKAYTVWTIGAKGASRPSVAHGLLLTPRSVDFDFFVSLPPSPSQPMRSSCLSDWISLGFAASYRNLPAERSILLLPRGLFHRRRGPPARRRMVAGGPARAAHWATAHQPPTTPPPLHSTYAPGPWASARQRSPRLPSLSLPSCAQARPNPNRACSCLVCS